MLSGFSYIEGICIVGASGVIIAMLVMCMNVQQHG